MPKTRPYRVNDAIVLAVPPIAPLVQSRPRLALSAHSTVVTEVWASAGAGKTTLLSLWAHALQADGEKVAWVGLPSGVGSRPSLSTLVDEAVRRSLPNPLDTPVAAALRHADEPMTLIFDDLHHLRSRADSEWLLGLIREKDPSVRIVLAGRFPPSSLAKRSLLPDSVEYRSEDLAFNREEARQFFAARSTTLDEGELDAACERTGGWAAALALLAGWMRGAPRPQRLPRNFSGDHRAIADYLVSEVLEQLAPAQREFLLTTSVVDAITLPFAVFLTGRDDAGDILDYLESHTSLVSHRPDDEGVYTYHPILLSYLRAELRRRDFGGFAQSVSTAVTWYRRNTRADLALELCLRCGHTADLAASVDEAGASLVFEGQAELVVRALAALERAGLRSTTTHVLSALVSAPYFPDELRVDHHLAAAAQTLGDAAVSIRLIHATLAVLRGADAERPTLLNTLVAVEAEVPNAETLQGEGLAIAAGDIAQNAEPHSAVFGDAVLYDAVLFSRLAHAAAAEADDRVDEALDIVLDAVRSSRFSSHAWLHLILLDASSTVAARQGRWPESAAFHEEMATLAGADGPPTNLVEAHVRFAVTQAEFERVTSDHLEAQLDDLIAALPLELAPGVVIPARALRYLQRLDAHVQPRTTIDDLDRLLKAHGHAHPGTVAFCSFRYVAAMLHMHDRHQAKQAVDLVTAELGESSLESVLVVALYNFSTGRQAMVESALEEALLNPHTIWNGTTPVFGWLLLADWAEISGRSTRADSLVVKALEIADLTQTRRPFIAEEQRGARLLEPRIGRLGSHDVFARSIVGAAASLLPPGQPRMKDTAYFTPKEREILRELPRHQSVSEIAAKQQLSPNTIKTHMRSIYQKLGVSGRADAVEQAEANGLL